MLRRVGTDDMRKKMGEILDCVNLRDDEFIIERKNKPIAWLASMKRMNSLRTMATSFLLNFLSKGGEIELSDAEIAKIADDAEHQARISKEKSS
jgi:hypothetical protein